LTEDQSNAGRLGTLGLLSGGVSWALIVIVSVGYPSFESPSWNGLIFSQLSILPGLVFGAIVGVSLRCRGWRGWLGYVFAAGLAYYCAFHVAYHLFGILDNALRSVGASLIIAGIPAGLTGSFLLGLMTTQVFRAPRSFVLRRPVLIGGAVGALLWLAQVEQPPWAWGYLPLFALWQGAYAASLAPLLRQEVSPATEFDELPTDGRDEVTLR
jgi:hypothetical protein